MHNGDSGYRANFDNRNKIINNNTTFRVFARDNPTSLDILPIGDQPFKGNKEYEKMKAYANRGPEDDPEIREKFVQNENVFKTHPHRAFGPKFD